VETGYLLAFSTGVLGGFGHCLGMCGPLVASYSLSASPSAARSASSRLAPHLLYNTGRITTYGLLGGIMGLSGSFVNVAGRLAGVQNVVAVIAGIMMIFMGMSISGLVGRLGWIEKHNFPILRLAAALRSSTSPLRYYPLGLLLGLLPCGLSYTVFIASAGAGGIFPGMLTALSFGLGTLPALIVFGSFISFAGASLRGRLYQASGALVVIMGLYFLFRGMSIYADL
jgi:sulfite exporter TauE/SafE